MCLWLRNKLGSWSTEKRRQLAGPTSEVVGCHLSRFLARSPGRTHFQPRLEIKRDRFRSFAGVRWSGELSSVPRQDEIRKVVRVLGPPLTWLAHAMRDHAEKSIT